MALVTGFFPSPAFQRQFGERRHGTGEHQITFIWQALLPFGSQIGCFIRSVSSSVPTKRFGYKTTTRTALLASCLTTFIPLFASKIGILFAGCIIQGIPFGLYSVSAPAYMSDVASPRLRSMMTTVINLCWCFGQMIAATALLIIRYFPEEWRVRGAFVLQFVICFTLFGLMSFLPESPYWHLSQQDIPAARQSLKQLLHRDSHGRVEEKLAALVETLKEEEDREQARLHARQEARINGEFIRHHLAIFLNPARRRTEIAATTWVIQSLCGSCLISWATTLFKRAGLEDSLIFILNIALTGVGVLGTLASWPLMQYFGRLRIYRIGLMSMTLILAVISSIGFASHIPAWVPGSMLIAFTLAYNTSVGPITFAIVSETSSIHLRAPTMALGSSLYNLTQIALHFLVPLMLSAEEWNLGPRTALVFAGVCALGCLYTHFRVPETQGLSVRHIDILFERNTPSRRFQAETGRLSVEEEREVRSGHDNHH